LSESTRRSLPHPVPMAAYFFVQQVDIDIRLADEDQRKQFEPRPDPAKDGSGRPDSGPRMSCPVYYDGEGIMGTVGVRVRDGKKLVHEGIKVEFVGSIELFYDRGHHHEFLSLSQELAAPGELRAAQNFDFHFKNVEKQFESYAGINVKLRCVRVLYVGRVDADEEGRYLVRVTLSRRLADAVKERELWVHSFRMPPEINNRQV